MNVHLQDTYTIHTWQRCNKSSSNSHIFFFFWLLKMQAVSPHFNQLSEKVTMRHNSTGMYEQWTEITSELSSKPYLIYHFDKRIGTLSLQDTYISLQDRNISSISLESFSCMANLRAWGNRLNFLYNSTAVFNNVIFSGSGTYGTQLKHKQYVKLK